MIEQLAAFVPGAMFQFRVLPDGTRRLDHMTRGCYDLWELDPGALDQEMTALWRMVDPRDAPDMRASIDECAAQLRDWSWQ
ncbi:MAG: hypothetical protein Q8O50_04785, partial [Hydrogenophaga sp.]|nr:hypothetical protein [Hydrogenophaga sp.]